MKYIILVERLDTTPDGTGIKQTQAYEYVEGERPEETLKRINGWRLNGGGYADRSEQFKVVPLLPFEGGYQSERGG
jgi:hypothetical protein